MKKYLVLIGCAIRYLFVLPLYCYVFPLPLWTNCRVHDECELESGVVVVGLPVVAGELEAVAGEAEKERLHVGFREREREKDFSK